MLSFYTRGLEGAWPWASRAVPIRFQMPSAIARMPCLRVLLSSSETEASTVFMLIERKIQFTQGNSKIDVVLNNAHRIFRHARGRNFTRACISYGNAYPINARNSIFRNFYDSNATQAPFVIIFLACVLLE